MAERVVKVNLLAETANFVRGMTEAEASAKKAETAIQKVARQREALSATGKASLVFGGLVAAGLALAVKAAAEFQERMAQVEALSGASATQMDALTNAALTLGQSMGYSADDVADAEIELVKAGVSVSDMLNGALSGSLALAADGQMSVADATQIAASAMTEFGLKGSDVPHIADLLAAGADKALGSVSELGQALNQSGLVADQFGLTVDDTVGTLSAFAQAGLLGSDAGTSFKTMLTQLAAPSKQSAALMEKLGISAYDAKGNFVGITEFAGILQDKLGGLTEKQRNQAEAQIFGNDAIRAANVLYKNGASGIQSWIDKVNDTGFATKQAQAKLNSLNGDLTKLKSAFQTGLIESGQDASSSLRGLVQSVTSIIEAYNGMSSAGKAVVFDIGAVIAATTLLGGGFLTVVPKIGSVIETMKSLRSSGVSLGKVFGASGAIALGLAAITLGMANVAAKTTLASDQLAELDSALKLSNLDALNKEFENSPILGGRFDAIGKTSGLKDALNQITSSSNKANIFFGEFLDGVDLGLTHIGGSAKKFSAQFEEIGTQLGQLASTDFGGATDSFKKLVTAAGGGNSAARKLLSVMPDYKAELVKLASAAGITLTKQQLLNLAQGKGTITTKLLAAAAKESSGSTDDEASSLSGLASEGESASDKIADVSNALKELASPTLDARSAQRDLEQAIDDATQALKDNGAALNKSKTDFDITTEAGRKNADAVDGIAQAAENAAGSIYTQTGSQEKATAALKSSRAELVRVLGQYGITGAAAEAYADNVMKTPRDWSTLFHAQTGTATGHVNAHKKNLASVPKKTSTELRAEIATAKAHVRDLKNRYSEVPKSKRTTLNAEIGSASRKIASLQAQLNAMRDKTVTVTLVGVDNATNVARQAAGHGVTKATGGAIYGPGTGTSDTAGLFRLSNGEHVLTASDVAKLGGQAGVYALRAAVQAGRYKAPGYASGGAVQYASPNVTVAAPASVAPVVLSPISVTVQNTGPSLSASTVVKAVRQADAIRGRR